MSERLTDEELNDADELIAMAFGRKADETLFQRLVLELRERRAQDLTPEEAETLHAVRGSVQYDWPGGELKRRCLPVLDKLIAAAEARRG